MYFFELTIIYLYLFAHACAAAILGPILSVAIIAIIALAVIYCMYKRAICCFKKPKSRGRTNIVDPKDPNGNANTSSRTETSLVREESEPVRPDRHPGM